MKYVIYELVEPDMIKRIDDSGYHLRMVNRTVLEQLDVSGVNEFHDSFEAALAEIEANSDKLKYKELTIIPRIYIDYSGTIQK